MCYQHTTHLLHSFIMPFTISVCAYKLIDKTYLLNLSDLAGGAEVCCVAPLPLASGEPNTKAELIKDVIYIKLVSDATETHPATVELREADFGPILKDLVPMCPACPGGAEDGGLPFFSITTCGYILGSGGQVLLLKKDSLPETFWLPSCAGLCCVEQDYRSVFALQSKCAACTTMYLD